MEKRDKVLKLRKEGKTLREIAAIMGYKSTSPVEHYLARQPFRRVWLSEEQIILLESILIQIKPTSEFAAESLYEIGEALKKARGK